MRGRRGDLPCLPLPFFIGLSLNGPKDIHEVYRKYLRAMTTLLENGLPVSHVMEGVKGPLLIQRG